MNANGIEYSLQETLLKLSNVSVAYDGKPILRDLHLEIKNLTRPGQTQGQVVGLLGPSGMGKTTLFRVLAGLETPESGTVLVEKEQVEVQRGMVGVVAQNYPLFSHRTVRGNLLVAGKQAGLSSTRLSEKADGLLKHFGIAEHAAKYPSQLSGGQRQRAAIAQQFMCSEHFLLMDEPFSGLDLLAQERVMNFIREMAASDEFKTFIIVTHDISAALQVCDTILLLGRDRDENGNPIPGARIQTSYDLIERGVCYQENITATQAYLALREEMRQRFRTL